MNNDENLGEKKSHKFKIVRHRKPNNLANSLLRIVAIICVCRMVALIIIDSQSASDGGLPGAAAMLIYFPITLIALSISTGSIEIISSNGRSFNINLPKVLLLVLLIYEVSLFFSK